MLKRVLDYNIGEVVLNKKIIKFLTHSVLIFVLLSVSFALGCQDGLFGGNAGNNPSSILKPDNISVVTYNDANNEYTQNKKEADLQTAINSTFQSVVYIDVKTDGGTAVGCGVIVDITVGAQTTPDIIYVYTCYHVVEDYISLSLSIPYVPSYMDGNVKKYDYANIDFDRYTFTTEGTNPTIAFIGGDRETDVAVLKVDISGYPDLQVVKAPVASVVETGDTKGALVRPYELGQTVLVTGNPSGVLKGTTTTGIISSVNTRVSISDLGEFTLVQIDAPVSQGNSGGGVFNLYGELIGILNSGNPNYENVGFAIPVTLSSPTKNYSKTQDTGFRNVADQLITTAWNDGNGNFNYGYIEGKWKFGVSVGYATTNYYGQTVETFPFVSYVESTSPFYGKLTVNKYIAGISYSFEGETIYKYLSSSDKSLARQEFEDAYYLLKTRIGIGQDVTIYLTDSMTNGAKTPVTATMKQYIYRDTGMRKSV